MNNSRDDAHAAMRAMATLYTAAVPTASVQVKDGIVTSISQTTKVAVADHVLVDRVAQSINGVATIFEKQGGDFVRISTNVKKENGDRRLEPSWQRIIRLRRSWRVVRLLWPGNFVRARLHYRLFPGQGRLWINNGNAVHRDPARSVFRRTQRFGNADAGHGDHLESARWSGSFVMSRRLVRPLPVLTETIRAIAEGRSSTVPFTDRSNEFGDIAPRLEVFRRNAEEKQQVEMRSQEERIAAEAQRRQHDEEKSLVDGQINQAVAELGSALARLAQGDLTGPSIRSLPVALSIAAGFQTHPSPDFAKRSRRSHAAPLASEWYFGP